MTRACGKEWGVRSLYGSWKGIRAMGKSAVLRRYLTGALGVSMLVCASTGYADSTQLPHEDELETETGKPRFVAADVPGQEHAADDVVIKNAWMQHVGEGQHYVAAYFELENNSDTSYLIDRISSSSCTVMFGYHSDLEVGTLTRQLFTHLTLPAKQMLVFPPGGYHLVCKVADGKTINQGMSIPVQFHFLGGSEKTVNFEVRSARVHRPVGVSYNKLK
ncbi:copper chaperone PCu(A)C [Acetobacter sp. UBA5411]|uniref:copper chaperone PCu(A)C n=1 Tax=Acetobacter sp. UBA5411 TaxID=1945905 RepID=UPI0025B86E00|nr:copper chaperone PCu(A)C [Acetobacter sp. UBA5411]